MGANTIVITAPLDYNSSTSTGSSTMYFYAHPSFIVMWSSCAASSGFSGTQIFNGNGASGALINSIGTGMSAGYGIEYKASTSGNNRMYIIKTTYSYNEVTIFYPSSITVQ